MSSTVYDDGARSSTPPGAAPWPTRLPRPPCRRLTRKPTSWATRCSWKTASAAGQPGCWPAPPCSTGQSAMDWRERLAQTSEWTGHQPQALQHWLVLARRTGTASLPGRPYCVWPRACSTMRPWPRPLGHALQARPGDRALLHAFVAAGAGGRTPGRHRLPAAPHPHRRHPGAAGPTGRTLCKPARLAPGHLAAAAGRPGPAQRPAGHAGRAAGARAGAARPGPGLAGSGPCPAAPAGVRSSRHPLARHRRRGRKPRPPGPGRGCLPPAPCHARGRTDRLRRPHPPAAGPQPLQAAEAAWQAWERFHKPPATCCKPGRSGATATSGP